MPSWWFCSAYSIGIICWATTSDSAPVTTSQPASPNPAAGTPAPSASHGSPASGRAGVGGAAPRTDACCRSGTSARGGGDRTELRRRAGRAEWRQRHRGPFRAGRHDRVASQRSGPCPRGRGQFGSLGLHATAASLGLAQNRAAIDRSRRQAPAFEGIGHGRNQRLDPAAGGVDRPRQADRPPFQSRTGASGQGRRGCSRAITRAAATGKRRAIGNGPPRRAFAPRPGPTSRS